MAFAWLATAATRRHGLEQSMRWRGLGKVQCQGQHDQREEEGPAVEEDQWWRKLYYLAIHGESEEEGWRGSEK